MNSKKITVSNNNRGQKYNQEYELDKVGSIHMEVDLAEVNIIEYEGDTIKVNGDVSNNFKCNLTGTTLDIYEKTSGKGYLFWRESNINSTIDIYIPRDKTFGSFEVELGAGEVKADYISTEYLQVEVGAGRFQLQSAKVAGKSSFEVGAGELLLTGTLNGDCVIECGIGKVEMNLNNSESDFNYSVECGIGKVSVGDRSMSGLGSSRHTSEGALNEMNISCGVGKIEVYFNEKL